MRGRVRFRGGGLVVFVVEYQFTDAELAASPGLPRGWQLQGLRGDRAAAVEAAESLVACYGRRWRVVGYESAGGFWVPAWVFPDGVPDPA
jgi:hypothetical protein